MNQHVSIPRLTLIGAGPGDPDLITVKALRKLAEADVVLYDALVNTELLKYAPAGSRKIFVGKRAASHRYSQDEINRMIVELAHTHGHVVRLKGGDPFIFGRGFEEFRYAVEHLVEVEVVPGISSSTGLPGMHQVPLTQRGKCESFWVVTGTTRSGEFSNDIRIAAGSTATAIILMGMKKLPEIVEAYKTEGKETMPVMIIQNGSMADEKKVTGNIFSIEEIVAREGIGAPAIIIIGEVVGSALRFIRENDRLKEQSAIKETGKTKQSPRGSFSTISITT